MDIRRVDDLSHSVFTGASRRAWLAGLASSLLAVLPSALGCDHAEAKKKGKKKKKEKTFKFVADPMTGAQEVAPTVGDPLGQGNASFTVKGKKICGVFNLSTATSLNVTGTHIHEGGADVNGPIVVAFGVATLGVKTCLSAGGILSQIKANPAGFYANIHTDTNPNGAVRGQLQRV